MIRTDKNGHIESMNPEAEKLTGWSLTEAVGKPLTRVFNVLNEKTREPCRNPVEQVLTSNRVVELENHTILLSKDGHERHIADSGAPISYSILVSHDGYISAESEVGVGTTFHIYLPASEKQVRSEAQQEENSILGNGRILVMDDEQLIRDMATKPH